MGVRGLWKLLEPTARPVLLESLRGKVLAVDASIWIYHFIKAMRDPGGIVMRGAHIVGFFRRICKLLFCEIKPVFIFDGAAPLLKKQTVARRQHRRQGREYNAKSTANKLLTLQLQRFASERAEQDRLEALRSDKPRVVGSIPENATYLDSSGVGTADSQSSSKSENKPSEPFRPIDQYHLPEISSVAPVRMNDQRLLTEEELDDYAEQFTAQAREGFIDTSAVDFESPEFNQLPITTRYQLLNTARMKSRLRMGYNAGDLRKMFPDTMDFSKFQIERVAQRNYFSQRILNMVGLDEDLTRRVSSEKNREYMLKRSDEGWTLSLEEQQDKDKAESLSFRSSRTGGSVPERRAGPVKQEQEQPETEADRNARELAAIMPAGELDGYEPEKIEPAELPASLRQPESESEEDDFEDVDLENVEPKPAQSPQQTLEQEADLTAIFGYESALQREKLISKSEAEPTNASTGRKRGRLLDGLLFNTPKKANIDTVSENPKPKSIQAGSDIPAESVEEPPWFQQGDTGSAKEFEDMTVPDKPGLDNLVPFEQMDDLVVSDDEPEILKEESVSRPALAVSDARPSSEISSGPHSIPKEAKDNDIVTSQSAARVGDTPLPAQASAVSASPVQPAAVGEPEVEASAQEPVEMTETEKTLADDEALADEEEDQELAEMLIGEAEENERFARELNKNAWTGAREQVFRREIDTLRKQFAKESRDADNITDEMIEECQELLQLFGIPYLTAPTEAEAQCAELQSLGLVDGVVTDDGDCFLFGDVSVYRNMFNQSKFVESYNSDVITRELGLDREKLISLAILLGSDYTDGLVGIGPVTAVEVVAEFGTLDNFKLWWEQAQRFPEEADLGTTFRRRFLNKHGSKLFLADDFPDKVVVKAYRKPVVDHDETPFKWGAPDLDGIRAYMLRMAGWSEETTNQVIIPVVQEHKRRELLRKQGGMTQASLDDYVTTTRQLNLGSKRASQAAAKLRSKK